MNIFNQSLYLCFFDATEIRIGRRSLMRLGQAPHDHAAGGPFYLPARWRCIDSRIQTQTCESMQSRSSSLGKPCIDSRFQVQTHVSMQPKGQNRSKPSCPREDGIVPRPGNAGWAGTSDGVAARGFVNGRGPPRSGGRESTAGAHRSEVPARRQTRTRKQLCPPQADSAAGTLSTRYKKRVPTHR